jgi:two-component system CitB family response regulator
MTNVLVVDDDYRVAELHRGVAEQLGGYRVVATAGTLKSAAAAVSRYRPDLILLDLYLPDGFGLDLLKRLRAEGTAVDAIVLTAAEDISRVQESLRLGALQYLIKPFPLARLRDHLVAYQRLQRHLRWSQASQGVVDRAYQLLGTCGEDDSTSSNPTVQAIQDTLRDRGDWVSATDVSEQVGISLSTARRYLSRLVESGKTELSLRYGVAGRPVHLYRDVRTQRVSR